MDLGLKGKKALITGGTSGMGRAAAELLVAESVSVVLNYSSNDARAEEAKKAVTACARDADVHLIKADVSSPEDVDRMMKSADELLGGIDIIVHSAGIADAGSDPEGWRKTVSVHLDSTHFICSAVTPYMEKQNGGRIIIIASIAAHTTGNNAYCAAMAGKICYAKGLAKRLAPKGINVNCISPGTIFTEMLDPFIPAEKRDEFTKNNIPLYKNKDGIPEADAIGKVILFFASSLSDHITGQDIQVNGGQDIHL